MLARIMEVDFDERVIRAIYGEKAAAGGRALEDKTENALLDSVGSGYLSDGGRRSRSSIESSV